MITLVFVESRASVDSVVGLVWIRQGNRSHHQTNLAPISKLKQRFRRISSTKEPEIEEIRRIRLSRRIRKLPNRDGGINTLIIDRFRVGSGFQLVVVFIYCIQYITHGNERTVNLFQSCLLPNCSISVQLVRHIPGK